MKRIRELFHSIDEGSLSVGHALYIGICLLIILICSLSSCTMYQHEAHAKSGAWERNTIVKLGGKASQQGADGSSFVSEDTESFQHFAQAIGIAITGWSAVARNQATQTYNAYAAHQITRQQASANLKEIAITQSNNQLTGKLAELEEVVP